MNELVSQFEPTWGEVLSFLFYFIALALVPYHEGKSLQRNSRLVGHGGIEYWCVTDRYELEGALFITTVMVAGPIFISGPADLPPFMRILLAVWALVTFVTGWFESSRKRVEAENKRITELQTA